MDDPYSILARFKEPSSWSALAALLAIFGVNVAPETWQAIVALGGGIAALAGVLLPERK